MNTTHQQNTIVKRKFTIIYSNTQIFFNIYERSNRMKYTKVKSLTIRRPNTFISFFAIRKKILFIKMTKKYFLSTLFCNLLSNFPFFDQLPKLNEICLNFRANFDDNQVKFKKKFSFTFFVKKYIWKRIIAPLKGKVFLKFFTNLNENMY